MCGTRDTNTNGRDRTICDSHRELEHLTTMKARQSSVDDDNKRAEDDDVEDEAMKAMMLTKHLWKP